MATVEAAPNISYDACEYPCLRMLNRTIFFDITSSANQMTYYNPDSGLTVVYNGGDIAWVLASTALVWIMIPGVGYFYSGLLRRKNALSMIYLSMSKASENAKQRLSADGER